MAYRSFEELEVWKRASQLAVQVYEALRESRDFALRDQMQRAAVSIPSNIRKGPNEAAKTSSGFYGLRGVPLLNFARSVTSPPKSAYSQLIR